MTAPFDVPGYDVEALLGTGGTGEVWRGRERATGRPVALKRLRDGADPHALQAEARALAAVDTPYLLRLHEVVGSGERAVLVLDLAAGGSLAALLQRRGSLSPGEVVTIAVPVAQALAAAHAAGLVHGDVSPANVLLTEEGMPLLSDLGSAGPGRPLRATAEYLDPAVAAGGPVTDASDVWALAALCHHLLAGSAPHDGVAVDDVLGAARAGRRAPLGLLAPAAPRALVDAVEAALVRDPALRPDAAGFAASLRRAHAAEPVRFDGPAAAAAVPDVRATHAVPRHAAPPRVDVSATTRRRALPRWLVPTAVGVVLLVAAASVGWWWGRGEAPPTAVPLSAPTSAAPAPSRCCCCRAGLAQPARRARRRPRGGVRGRRPRAARRRLRAGRPRARGRPGPGRAAGRAGADGRGVRHEVREVEQLERGDDRARLRVVDVLRAYEVRDAGGGVVSRTPSRGEAPYLVELALTERGWRLLTVTPA
jgi:hypothetical protein